MADTVMRNRIADYLNVGTDAEDYVLMGVGFNTLDENPSAQTESKTYIHQSAQTSQIKSYQPSFPFDTDLVADEKAVMALYAVGRDQKTGAGAEMDYVRVELFEPVASKENTFRARKFRVAVQVDSVAGAGGETVKVTGNLMGVGDFVDGEFNTTTRAFTPANPDPALGALTVTSAEGGTSGKTALTVTPAKAAGNGYKYKTAASVTPPAYGAACTTGYTAWDGSAEITATTGQKILVVEVTADNKARAAGIATVTAKA